jgi:hypothetical protein
MTTAGVGSSGNDRPERDYSEAEPRGLPDRSMVLHITGYKRSIMDAQENDEEKHILRVKKMSEFAEFSDCTNQSRCWIIYETLLRKSCAARSFLKEKDVKMEKSNIPFYFEY